MNESGITVVQKPSNTLALKDKSQVGAITSLERGQNISIICCMNAIDSFAPPGFIFPRVCMKVELQDDAPPESMFAYQASDFFYITISFFISTGCFWQKNLGFNEKFKPSNLICSQMYYLHSF